MTTIIEWREDDPRDEFTQRVLQVMYDIDKVLAGKDMALIPPAIIQLLVILGIDALPTEGGYELVREVRKVCDAIEQKLKQRTMQ